MSDTSTGGRSQILGEIRSGKRAEITTPTGKEWTVWYELSEFVIQESNGLTVSGERAKERLENALRLVGTECSLRTDSEQ